MAIQSNKYQTMENILNEGGNAIKGAQPIRGDLANFVAQELISILKSKYPNNHFSTLGSTGKKGKDQMSGDIDIAVDIPIEKAEEVKDFLTSYPSVKKRGGMDTNFMKGLKILSVGYPWATRGVGPDSHGIVQCDLMFVPDVQRAAYFYYSPDFTKGQSQFKGSVRNIFMIAILKNIPVKHHPTRTFPNGDIRDFWKYTIKPQEGIVCLHQSYEGKKGQQVKSKHTIKEDTEIVDQNPKRFTKFFMGPKATEEDVSSFEKMWEYVNDDTKFPWLQQRDKMIKDFVEDLTNENTSNPDMVEDVIKWMRENSSSDMASLFRRGLG